MFQFAFAKKFRIQLCRLSIFTSARKVWSVQDSFAKRFPIPKLRISSINGRNAVSDRIKNVEKEKMKMRTEKKIKNRD
jgi:hypothetical protein